VGWRLRLTDSTVYRLYAQAYRDIQGEPLRGTTAKRRAAAIDPEEFWRCGNCFRDPRQPGCQMHRAALEAYLNQDRAGRRAQEDGQASD
jgi:hypothetical protein